MDWQYALNLDLTDPGFDLTLLHNFRRRLLAHEAAQCLLATFLAALSPAMLSCAAALPRPPVAPVRPARHEATQPARQRQATAVCKAQYALPAVPLVPSPEAAEPSGLLRPV
jgi:hypothetical protein